MEHKTEESNSYRSINFKKNLFRKKKWKKEIVLELNKNLNRESKRGATENQAESLDV